jgi:hypothetical protein
MRADDSRRAAEVAEAIDVAVALDLANELHAVALQASDDPVDVVDDECARMFPAMPWPERDHPVRDLTTSAHSIRRCGG